MANIQNELNNIKNAVFGKDVRDSIHDAIKTCYDDASIVNDNANMEVKMARGVHNTLGDRLNEVDSQLEQNMYSIDVKNQGQETNSSAVIRATSSNLSTKRVMEIYNYSGVKSDGSHTNADGKESFVIHHYNDKDMATLDYVGRGGTIALFRMAVNNGASGHTETGDGYFMRFERTTSQDSNTANPVNRTLFGAKQVDLYDIGLSTTKDAWCCALHGKDNAKTSTIGQGYIQEPLLVYTYGNTNQQGGAALKVYSNSYGGNALELQTRSLANGVALKVTHSVDAKNAVEIDNYSSKSSINIISRKDGVTDIALTTNVVKTNGFLIKATDNIGGITFGVAAKGDHLYLKDYATGEQRIIRINNGTLEVL